MSHEADAHATDGFLFLSKKDANQKDHVCKCKFTLADQYHARQATYRTDIQTKITQKTRARHFASGQTSPRLRKSSGK